MPDFLPEAPIPKPQRSHSLKMGDAYLLPSVLGEFNVNPLADETIINSHRLGA